jgi:hypothetical protein
MAESRSVYGVTRNVTAAGWHRDAIKPRHDGDATVRAATAQRRCVSHEPLLGRPG